MKWLFWHKHPQTKLNIYTSTQAFTEIPATNFSSSTLATCRYCDGLQGTALGVVGIMIPQEDGTLKRTCICAFI